jgi:hypothetical protein
MAHNVSWLKEKRILLAEFSGHQNEETLRASMDEIATSFDARNDPFVMLIDWREVTHCEIKALLSMRGHPFYKHPMTAREVLVGMDALARFENEISAVKTRSFKNTMYFDTMEQALHYLDEMLTTAESVH